MLAKIVGNTGSKKPTKEDVFIEAAENVLQNATPEQLKELSTPIVNTQKDEKNYKGLIAIGIIAALAIVLFTAKKKRKKRK